MKLPPGWIKMTGRAHRVYWSEIYEKVDSDIEVVVLKVGGGFFIAPDSGSALHDVDVGPFDTAAEACFAADLMVDLKGYPRTWDKYLYL